MTQASNLRRVKRDPSPFVERRTDGLDICLDCWKEWMGRNDTDLGAQSQKTLRGDGDGYGNTDTSQMRRDNEIAQATDAMIHSLSSVHRWAIHRKAGLATAWRFPNLDYLTVAIEACEVLEKKLRGNNATRMVFV
jgi:hypothetical protein